MEENERNQFLSFEFFKSLCARNDIVIKPADKGGALVDWRADLYRDGAHRQLSDTAFYSRVDRDLTPTHQTTISNTIHTFITNGDLPHTAKNFISITPCTPVMYFLPKIHKPDNPGRPIVSACGVPLNSSLVILIMLWHPWLGTYLPTSRIPNMLSRSFIFLVHINSSSAWMSNPCILSFRITMV